MKELIKEGNAPILFPYAPNEYWQSIREIIREEMVKIENRNSATVNVLETPGMAYKPLLKITELCILFQVTKPTIYSWIKIGKLKPIKIRSRVYFLYQDIQKLMSTESQDLE